MDIRDSERIPVCNSSGTAIRQLPFMQREILNLKKPIGRPLPKENHRTVRGEEKLASSDARTEREFTHGSTEFCASCACLECVEYRETVATVLQDQLISVELWDAVKNILQNCYRNILRGCSSSVWDLYHQLTSEAKFGWQSDGCVNRTKKEHLEFIAGVSDEVTKFVFCCTLLLADDSHQLLELLSYEAECFARAYARGIQDRRFTSSQTDVSAEDKINYIVQGYEKICELSEKIKSLLFTFESNHLKKFHLTWVLLNRRMYQKYVFASFSETAIQCMLKLKSEVSTSRYIEILRKYINFDDEMLSVKENWKSVWELLNRHHMAGEDIERRERIRLIHNTFECIQDLSDERSHGVVDKARWEDFEDRGIVWQNVISAAKNIWQKNDKTRLNATVHLEKCVSCKTCTDNHKISCKCVTCSIAGPYYSSAKEDLVKNLCYKCALVQNAIQDKTGSSAFINNLKKALKEEYGKNVSGKLLNNRSSSEYHISWAVFKNLEADNKPCNMHDVNAVNFCTDCQRSECMLGRMIVNNEIPAELSKLAISFYRPLLLSTEENEAAVPSVKVYLEHITVAGVSPFFESEDFILKTFLSFCHSVFLKHYVDSLPSHQDSLNIENIQISKNGVHLKTEYLKPVPNNSFIGTSLVDTPNQFTYHSILALLNDTEPNPNPQLSQGGVSSEVQLTDKEGVEFSKNLSRSKQQKKNVKPQKQVESAPLQDEVCKNDQMVKGRLENIGKGSVEDLSYKGPGNDNTKKTKDALSNKKSVDKWIKETLNFIEGDEKEKFASKKAEKKHRQKLKKEELKRVEELHNLKAQYQDIYFKEFAAKQELKNFKSAKKKDKKKILEIENNVKKLNVAKLKVEKSILESLAIVKSINPNFKLSYLPTREEQEQAMQKHEIIKVDEDSASISQKAAANLRLHMPVSTAFIEAEPCATPMSSTEFISDPSKRIVTIRRVNLPHLAEPQVTVTAKGASPRDDKLLYTFINGQIVPASSLDTQMLSILTSQTTPFAHKDLHPTIQEQGSFTNVLSGSHCTHESRSGQKDVILKFNQVEKGGKVTSDSKNNKTKGSDRNSRVMSNNALRKEYVRSDSDRIPAVMSENHVNPVNGSETSSDCKVKTRKKKRKAKKRPDECSITPMETEEVVSNSNSPNCRPPVETTTNSICDSMRSLSINAEAIDEHKRNEVRQSSSYTHLNVSIMDQINKGIQVENLTLPPGITLTKVDPVEAGRIKAKRESIERLSRQMKEPENPVTILPNHVDLRIMNHENVINCQKSTFSEETNPPRSKRKQKKNKHPKSANAKNGNSNQSEIVTLRNPIFQQAKGGEMPLNLAGNCMQIKSLPMDQPAAIIKNENGMFTIRNPALHRAALSPQAGAMSPFPYLYISNHRDADQTIACQQSAYSNHQYVSPMGPNSDVKCTNTRPELKMYNVINEPSRFVIDSSSGVENVKSVSDATDYDKMHILRNLKPGQRLNSEVTIHNVNERSNDNFSSQSDSLEIRPLLLERMSLESSKLCSN
ncbi:uncharacterized protein LOC119651981 isoform X2 [Hermetia illucens]|uniref:uncharacterized protein LOC119651981 isoform X2 n=1 Tax=Hermetia illucens TaxID=343691 RepID=UPI0018CC1604|nr:uncharacterized protein LOC119651981 isoform X2 [Hermetia illucens]